MVKLDVNSQAEFVGQIIDIFEDYLTDRGIRLKNEQREAAVVAAQSADFDDYDAAIIYGESYDTIANEIYGILRSIQVDGEDSFHTVIFGSNEETEIGNIMVVFNNVLEDGGYSKSIPYSDVKTIAKEIKGTFINWKLWLPEYVG